MGRKNQCRQTEKNDTSSRHQRKEIILNVRITQASEYYQYQKSYQKSVAEPDERFSRRPTSRSTDRIP
ncbi:unnamed protein product [Schistosoma curassoni]|uniref:Uncharacterized protein n=1 Tax=Schistosoma curassoni TaxID=6186 RepID=A0A3P8CV71_9TREM|nr:unnamed protein product [Schistosoma curassoni]